MHRAIPIHERFQLQIRADCFDIFNHPNCGDPTVTYRSGQFGYSSAILSKSLGAGGGAGANPLFKVGGPRSVQLALKLVF